MSKERVFAIGLSRTGAKTLTDALSMLGYRAHFLLIDDDFEAVLEQFDAVTHLPLVEKYRELDQRFPGSKFILSVREKEEWLASCEYRVGLTAGSASAASGPLMQRIYGTMKFDRKLFSETYDRYHEEVREHFRGREDSLLIVDICGGDGFEKLCPFLGKETPVEPFPYNLKNSRSNLQRPTQKLKRFLSRHLRLSQAKRFFKRLFGKY